MLISVIIPVYNRQENLSMTVDSVLNQTYKDIEVILIDDGSIDDSGNMCDEYAKKDSRVKVIHQKNKGASCARNAGIQVANGEYISFIDAGDYVETNLYQSLLEYMEKGIDYIDFPYYVKVRDGNRYPAMNTYEKNHIFDKSFINNKMLPFFLNLENNINNLVLAFLWRLLFKKSIIDKNNLAFNGAVRKWEDREFVLNYLNCCNTVVFTDIPLYTYICDDSQEHLATKYYPSLLRECVNKLKKRENTFSDKFSFLSKYYLSYSLNVFIERFYELSDYENENTVKNYIANFFENKFVQSIFTRYTELYNDDKRLSQYSCYVINNDMKSFYDFLVKDKRSRNKIKMKDKILQFAIKCKHKILK